jgi:hypothetical protein
MSASRGDAAAPASAPVGLLAAGLIDENAAQGLCCYPEEVPAAVPVPRRPAPDESDVRLMDEGGRLERLARPLLGEARGRELAPLVVDRQRQIGRGSRVPGRGEQASDVGHAPECTVRRGLRHEQLTAIPVARRGGMASFPFRRG